MKKRLDDRIPYLINQNIALNTRSFFIIMGANAHLNLPVLLQVYAQKCMHVPKLLWCYSERTDFKRYMKNYSNNSDEQKSLLDQSHVRYVNYRDVDYILGQTFSCLILYDFKSLTPNNLAKTVETVRGGGIVFLLINEITYLYQLGMMKMDAHKRYVTYSKLLENYKCIARFNERLVAMFKTCYSMLILDQSLDVLEISEAVTEMKDRIFDKPAQESDGALDALKQYAIDSGDPVKSSLSKIACTTDYCYVLLDVLDLFKLKKGVEVLPRKDGQDEDSNSESDKSEDLADEAAQKLTRDERREQARLKYLQKHNKKGYQQLLAYMEMNKAQTVQQAMQTSIFPQNYTVFLKAARGRGKSALAGLLVAAAISQYATNILIFAPNAGNVQTLFEFAIKGLEQLGYLYQVDYSIYKAGNLELDNIVYLNVFKNYKQTIKFIAPDEAAPELLAFADLIILDEAAAMPMNIVHYILQASAFIILSSTVHGYEGSGRALQLKVINQLKTRERQGYTLVQKYLVTPIRYGVGDRIESFLYRVLLLDVEEDEKSVRFPSLEETELYMVSRDALFSYEDAGEAFLRKIWAVFVNSHYKNQPNDLQLLGDNPNARVFVLLDVNQLKQDMSKIVPLCCIQTAYEGYIDQAYIRDGNLAPYILAQQFQQPKFSEFPGVRIVRIAVPYLCQKRGYGCHALRIMQNFFSGALVNDGKLSERVDRDMPAFKASEKLPPLLFRLQSVRPLRVKYMSVAFGLTLPLLHFYRQNAFKLVYLKATQSEETGERSCLMVHAIDGAFAYTREVLVADFTRRFFRQCDCGFRDLDIETVFYVLKMAEFAQYRFEMDQLSGTDFARIYSYIQRKIEFGSISDLVSIIGQDIYLRGNTQLLSYVYMRVMCGVCCYRKSFKAVAKELELKREQCEAIFVKGLEVVFAEYYKAEQEAMGARKLEAEKKLK